MIGAIISGIGAIFTATSGVFTSWFAHKTAKVEANRAVEIENIRAGVEIQKGSWKDEYFTVFWTAPLYQPLFGALWYWDANIFIKFVNELPGWYTTILIGMTTASFGVKTFKDWKAGVLDREIKWERAKNGNGNGNGHKYEEVVTPPVIKDPYEAVRPGPLPTDG